MGLILEFLLRELNYEEIKEEKGLLWRILDVVNEFLPKKEHTPN